MSNIWVQKFKFYLLVTGIESAPHTQNNCLILPYTVNNLSWKVSGNLVYIKLACCGTATLPYFKQSLTPYYKITLTPGFGGIVQRKPRWVNNGTSRLVLL